MELDRSLLFRFRSLCGYSTGTRNPARFDRRQRKNGRTFHNVASHLRKLDFKPRVQKTDLYASRHCFNDAGTIFIDSNELFGRIWCNPVPRIAYLLC